MTEFQSNYLNNPNSVLDYTVTIDNREESVLKAVRLIVPSWSEANLSDVRVQQLSGGITNTMYLLHWSIKESFSDGDVKRVLVRLFGAGTETLINREGENALFAALSKLNIGCPIFYGLFLNGRVEGYLPARAITPEEMKKPFIYKRVAAAVGRFHSRGRSVEDPLIPRKNRMLGSDGQFKQYLELGKRTKFEEGSKKASLLPSLEMGYMEAEVNWLIHWLETEANTSRTATLEFPLAHEQNCVVGFIPSDAITKEENHRNMARFLAFQEVLCHYDILCGNILLNLNLEGSLSLGIDDNGNEGITLIDYEYSAFTFRAFDIGNFFCEFAGFDKSIEEAYPAADIRRAVIEKYFDSCAEETLKQDVEGTEAHIWLYWQELRKSDKAEAVAATDSLVREFEVIANQLTLCAHTLWYLWGIVQADVSTVDFDYMDYSRVRLEGYKYHKAVFHSGTSLEN